jgi:hypothetical protein
MENSGTLEVCRPVIIITITIITVVVGVDDNGYVVAL